jgi:hypothetical protein
MHELRFERVHVALAQLEALLGEDDDAAAFRRFVGQRGQLRGVGQFASLTPSAGRKARPGGCPA